MKFIPALLFLLPLSFGASATLPTSSPLALEYAVTGSTPIGGSGRWDYVTVGPTDHLLYVTRTTHTQVIDPIAGKVVGDIPGGQRLHGTAVVPDANRGFITDGGTGTLIVFDLKSRQPIGTIPAADDADGIIYDPGTKRVLVSCGDGADLVIVDPTAALNADARTVVPLNGMPEYLAADGAGRAFVNLKDKNLVAVVNLTSKQVVARWTIADGTDPTAMAIDVADGRLFVGCRNQKLIILDTHSGRVLQSLPIGKGVDACVYDPVQHEAFASCGDGTVAIIAATAHGDCDVVQTLGTAAGSRTMTIDPLTHRLYLPAADFAPAPDGKGRPTMVPTSFRIMTASPASE